MDMKSLINRLTSLEKQSLNESAKPDFLDMDKDGNKKEPMKKAVADKKKPESGKVKKESLGRIAEALMKDMGYDLYEADSIPNPYTDPVQRAKFDTLSDEDKIWLTKPVTDVNGVTRPGQPDITDKFILNRAPNKGRPVQKPPTPFVPNPVGLDGTGGDKPRPDPTPFVPNPVGLDGTGGDKPRPDPTPFVPNPVGLDGTGGDKPIPRFDPAVIANNSEYDTAVRQGQDPNHPYPTPPTPPKPPKPPVTTQRKNPLFDPRVLAFQKELIKKGAKINPDGVYGKDTNKAAEQFGMAPPPGIKTTRDAGGSTPTPKSSTPPGKADLGKTKPVIPPPVATQPVTPDGKPPADADKSQPYWVDGNKYKWVSGRGGSGWALDQKKGEYSLWGGNEANKRSGYTDPSNVYTGPDKEPVQTQPVREDSELTAMLRIAGLR